jgi:hypothetical protein
MKNHHLFFLGWPLVAFNSQLQTADAWEASITVCDSGAGVARPKPCYLTGNDEALVADAAQSGFNRS